MALILLTVMATRMNVNHIMLLWRLWEGCPVLQTVPCKEHKTNFIIIIGFSVVWQLRAEVTQHQMRSHGMITNRKWSKNCDDLFWDTIPACLLDGSRKTNKAGPWTGFEQSTPECN